MMKAIKVTILSVILAAVTCCLCSGQVKVKVNHGVPNELNKDMFREVVADYINNPDEFKYVGKKPAIIDFGATWCGPCKQMEPIIEQIAREYKGKVYVYKVDVDKEKELASLFRVQNVPTLLFIPMEGQPIRSVGAVSREQVRYIVDTELLGKK